MLPVACGVALSSFVIGFNELNHIQARRRRASQTIIHPTILSSSMK